RSRAFMGLDSLCETRSGKAVAPNQFIDRAPRLIDRLVHEGGGSSVAVRDGNATERLTADDVRTLFVGHIRIAQAVVRVSIAVRAAIDADAKNIGRRVETAGTENPRELASRLELHLFPRCLQQLAPSGLLLLPWREAAPSVGAPE